MDAVWREAVPRIPFPWKRALPGLCAAGLALVLVLVLEVSRFVRGTATEPIPAELVSAFGLVLQCWKTVGGEMDRSSVDHESRFGETLHALRLAKPEGTTGQLLLRRPQHI